MSSENENINDLIYCLKCKSKNECKDASIKTTKNNRKYKQASCVKCGSKVNQFLKNDKPKIEELLNNNKEE